MVSCFMSLLFALSFVTPCETAVGSGLDRPYAFTETSFRPLSIAFEQDTRAYVKHDGYELSLDLWRMPSAGTQRPAMGIDLWSLMIGKEF
jgi:hypothetical protein